jgi:periplasmic divalent cation tolerance protein
MNNKEIGVVLCTAPSKDIGAKIAHKIVTQRLAACVNIVSSIDSTYTWKGKLYQEKEVLLIIKTRPGLFEKLSEEIKRLHPYEVPEILLLPVLKGNEAYLNWVKESTEDPPC